MSAEHSKGRQTSGASAPGSRSLVGLVAAVVVPMLILGILATLGIRSQRAAAREQARQEAAALVQARAQLLSEQLNAAILAVPQFPDPPLPGTPAPADAVLDGDDPDALARLRDDPGAGTSPAGLPRRALAALRLLELDPSRQDPRDLVQLICIDAPSILTPVGLERIRQRHPDLDPPPAWRHRAVIPRLVSEHPSGGWFQHFQEPWWISGDGTRFVPPSVLRTSAPETPPHVTARFSSQGRHLTGPADGEVLARASIEFPSPLALEWVLTAPALIEDSSRQQTRWTLALLAASLGASAIGLYTILRAFSRERRLNQLKSQFVSSVSHELRAPVGSIRLMADTLHQKRAKDPDKLFQLIARESSRLSHLIENVLDFARIEEGRRHYAFEECDLAALTRDTLDLFSHRLGETGHRFDPKLDNCTATVDPSALQQALVNLLDNALKFSPKGSPVAVRLSETDSTWSISVTSHGTPIPPPDRSRIFERFHRLGDELRREAQGTGIGLSIVRHVMHAHHGEVTVTSDTPDTNTFTLRAPLHPPVPA